MAAPMKGIWLARYGQPYSGATVWGTGINSVHSYYGSDLARQEPIRPMHGLAPPQHDRTEPHEGRPSSTHRDYLYGYVPEDRTYTTLETDERPPWNISTPDNPSRFAAGNQPPVDATGAQKNRFRDTFGGAFSHWRGKLPRANYMIPTETVTEGWRNKPKGEPANAKPSDPKQYEIQTSMAQRYQVRNNAHAVARGADMPREPIASRVIGQRIKVYSGNERHWDMFPRQQTPDELAREFYYRTAGTGEPAWMENNEQWNIAAIERTPPPDPYIGTPDTGESLQYGYAGEDYFYA